MKTLSTRSKGLRMCDLFVQSVRSHAADVELKKTLVVAIQKLEGDGYILNTIPNRCSSKIGLKVDTSEATSHVGRHKDVRDSNLGEEQESDVVDEESKSEVEDVMMKTTSFMTFNRVEWTLRRKSYMSVGNDDYVQGSHLKNFCLQSFDLILRTNGSSFDSISGMPLRDMEFIQNHTNILIHDDKLCYNKEELVMEHETLFSNVTNEQQNVYTKV
ncbi:hypothetical protein Tco_1023757 [Tanacetum coccineum]